MVGERKKRNYRLRACSFFMMIITVIIVCTNAAGNIYAASDENPIVPRVCIQTADGNGRSLTKAAGYIEAQIQVIDTNGDTIDSLGQIKVRGNSTAALEKKSYTIKFNKKYDLFQMGEAKKYVLLANCLDPTLIRNILAFNLADTLSLNYTSKYVVAEVWLDGQYIGVYDFVEPVEAKPSRVNISTDNNQDFLLEYESGRDEEGETYLKIDDWRFRIEAPKLPDDQELAYINDVMTNVSNVLKGDDYSQVKQKIDTDSFAKLYLLNELFKNVDFGWSSVYFYYQEGKLYAGPVWDFDLTMGNLNPNRSANYKNALDIVGLYAAEKHFYSYLFQFDEFKREFIELFAENYDAIEKIYIEGGDIDEITAQYQTVFDKNFSEAGWDVSKAYRGNMRVPDATYQENIKYLKEWLRERNEWMRIYYNIFEERVMGDVNVDGEFDISDVILLQKWLLAVSNTSLVNWKAADFCADEKLNAIDLCLMKHALFADD